jgi:hypothetical protein
MPRPRTILPDTDDAGAFLFLIQLDYWQAV